VANPSSGAYESLGWGIDKASCSDESESMKQVWTLQWATPDGIRCWGDPVAVYYTAECLEKIMTDAFEAGRKVGDLEGRVALRKLLDEEAS
jgi:hypothetical protein